MRSGKYCTAVCYTHSGSLTIAHIWVGLIAKFLAMQHNGIFQVNVQLANFPRRKAIEEYYPLSRILEADETVFWTTETAGELPAEPWMYECVDQAIKSGTHELFVRSPYIAEDGNPDLTTWFSETLEPYSRISAINVKTGTRVGLFVAPLGTDTVDIRKFPVQCPFLDTFLVQKRFGIDLTVDGCDIKDQLKWIWDEYALLFGGYYWEPIFAPVLAEPNEAKKLSSSMKGLMEVEFWSIRRWIDRYGEDGLLQMIFCWLQQTNHSPKDLKGMAEIFDLAKIPQMEKIKITRDFILAEKVRFI